MSRARAANQPDLFVPADSPERRAIDDLDEPPDEAFIQRIRAELLATLELYRTSSVLPWRYGVQAIMAEQSFRSMSKTWLPVEEGARLRAEFEIEVERLYLTNDPVEYD